MVALLDVATVHGTSESNPIYVLLFFQVEAFQFLIGAIQISAFLLS
jgi:hypothetical protein